MIYLHLRENQLPPKFKKILQNIKYLNSIKNKNIRKRESGMISDEMAYWQYLDGKEESADILVERYGDALTYYINGYIHDIHESEDLMIEAFAQIFAKERPIDGKGSFRAYLYKTARNLTIRHRQKHKIWFLHLDEVDFELPSEELVDAKL